MIVQMLIIAKFFIFIPLVFKNNVNFIYFCTAFRPHACSDALRRDGRVVDYNGLENRRTERCRGFESLSLRKVNLKPADFQRVLFFLK